MAGVAIFASMDVAPLTTTKEADEASDNVVPEIVIAGPPGTRVWSLIIKLATGDAGRSLIVLPATVIVSAVGFSMFDVTPSMTMNDADGARDSVVPEMVTAEPPGAIILSPTAKLPSTDPETGLNTSLPTTMVGGVFNSAAGLARDDVAPLITTKDAEGARDNVVPATVITEPPGTSVCSAITNLLPEPGRGLKTPLPTVRVGGVLIVAAGISTAEGTPLTTTNEPEGASDSVVPGTVMAGPPGARVWPATTNVGPGLRMLWVSGLFDLPSVGCAVMMELPTTICGGLLLACIDTGLTGNIWVDPPITTKPAEGARLTTVP
jgi:hypothetical protein